MSKVIHDMLELSRAGRPSPGNASPADVISAVLEELAGALGGAEVRIRVTDERVACTPNLLAQILSNLVSNAIKFRSASRPLVVAITAELRGAEVEITVEDNGMGIQEEEAAHVFEPFFRARTEREVPGYGLGLAIAHRAATALGGSCNMERAPSGGTRITVRLPRATSERPSRSFDVPVGKEIRRA
jgi:signal transduction histidine kinase